jgi:hypothetical protein
MGLSLEGNRFLIELLNFIFILEGFQSGDLDLSFVQAT